MPVRWRWPREGGELSRWMHWLLNAHVRRYHHVVQHDEVAPSPEDLAEEGLEIVDSAFVSG